MAASEDPLALLVVMPRDLDFAIFPRIIEHMPDFGVLYCNVCKQVCFPSALLRHLTEIHKIPAARRRPVVQFCLTLDVVDTKSDLRPLPDGSAILDFAPVFDGYACTCCRFLTTSQKLIRQHMITSHSIQHPASQTRYRQVKLQSWYPPSSRAQYWIVKTATAIDPSDQLANVTGIEIESAAILETLEDQERQRLELLENDHIAGDAEVEDDETTPWLQYTKWPEQFAGRPLDIITAAACQPEGCPIQDYTLGYWDGEAVVSSLENEIRVQQLARLLDGVFDRCEKTLASTPHMLQCWLKGYNQHRFYPKPFRTLQKLESRRRYCSQWKRFICFVFRVWAAPRNIQNEVFGVQYTDLQLYLLDKIWTALSVAQVESLRVTLGPHDTLGEADPLHLAGGHTQQELSEWLFHLSCSFLADLYPSGDTESSPLVYFTGVLGIHLQTLMYRTAYLFTPVLAGFIWIGRLLMLEYALPEQAWTILKWPSKASYKDQTARFKEIRDRYLCRGGFHPMGRMIEILRYGRAVARKEGSRGNISWSSDKETLQLYNQSLTMTAFRQMVWSTVQECHAQLHELMFHWQPLANLSQIIDNMADRRTGWSFLQEPANNLQLSFKHLHRRAWNDGKNGLMKRNRWAESRCAQYIKGVKAFKKKLLLCLHFTGGLPGRGTEVATIKWCNTRQVSRNVFVYHGRLILVLEYHKARAITNNSFYVVRVLPKAVSQILFQYLAYVRPFVEALSHQIQRVEGVEATIANSRAYLFAEDGQLFKTSQLSQAVQQQSQYAGVGHLNFARYRQTALAIAKQHIATIARPFDPDHPEDDDDPRLSFARQAGHRPQVLATAYAIDRAYPTRLQPELLSQYEKVSACWHKWLRIEELERQLVEQARLDIDNKTELHSTKRKAREGEEKEDVALKRIRTAAVGVGLPPNVIEALKIVARFFKV
jgi:hypothetical protein